MALRRGVGRQIVQAPFVALRSCVPASDCQCVPVRARAALALRNLRCSSGDAGELVVWLPQWRIRDVERGFAVWFVYPPKRIVSSKVRCFIDFIVERLGQAPNWK